MDLPPVSISSPPVLSLFFMTHAFAAKHCTRPVQSPPPLHPAKLRAKHSMSPSKRHYPGFIKQSSSTWPESLISPSTRRHKLTPQSSRLSRDAPPPQNRLALMQARLCSPRPHKLFHAMTSGRRRPCAAPRSLVRTLLSVKAGPWSAKVEKCSNPAGYAYCCFARKRLESSLTMIVLFTLSYVTFQ